MTGDAVNFSTTNEIPVPKEFHDRAWLITLRFVVVGVGIVLNGVVTAVFMYIRMYRKSLLHGLIVQQSFVDLFGCCMFIFFYNQDAPDGNGGKAFCKARGLFWFLTYTSIYNLVMITVERFIAVVHPIMYRNRNIGKKYHLFLIVPYIIGSLISFHLAIIADVNEDLAGECRYNYPNRAASLFSGLCTFLLMFFLPACFMIYCYCRIVLEIRKRARERQQQIVGCDKRLHHISVQRNLVYTMMLVVIGFVVTTSPNLIMYLVYNICQCFEFSTIIEHEITVLISTCNMCINPIIYGAKMNDFRKGLLKILRKLLLLLDDRDVGDESTVAQTSQNNTDTRI